MELDAMLCDHAEVVGGKLFINGAGIERMDVPPNAPPPYVAFFAVAGTVSVPWTSTNVNHALSFRFLTEDGAHPELPPGAIGPDGIQGEMQFNVGRPPQATSGQDQLVPFAFNFQGIPLMRAGRYVIELSIDGQPVRRLGFQIAQGHQELRYTIPMPGPI